MTLRDRLVANPVAGIAALRGERATGVGGKAYQDLKQRFHQEILDRVDLDRMQRLEPARVRAEIGALVEKMIGEQSVALNEGERAALVQEIQDEMLGLGPLEPLLADPTISDILVNGHDQVYIERTGKLEQVPMSGSATTTT